MYMLVYMEIMPRRFKSNDKNDLNSLLIIEKYNEIMFPVTKFVTLLPL